VDQVPERPVALASSVYITRAPSLQARALSNSKRLVVVDLEAVVDEEVNPVPQAVGQIAFESPTCRPTRLSPTSMSQPASELMSSICTWPW